MNLKDKVAIVTGAGSGIGRATALRLAAEGVNVIVNYSQSKEGALEVVEKIMDDGGVAIPYRADVSIEHEVQDMVTHTLMVFGKIDFLVNNASITSQIPMNELDKVTGEVWDSLFAVNVKGMFHCVKAGCTTYEKTIRRCNRQPRERSGSKRYWFFHFLCSHEIGHSYDDTLTCYLTRT